MCITSFKRVQLRFLGLWIFILLTHPLCLRAHADEVSLPATVSTFNEDNLLILEVSLNGRIRLSEGLLGYQDGKRVYLSLTDFAQILSFPITLDNEQRQVKGWFIREGRHFLLDRTNNTVVRDGETLTLQPGDIIEGNDQWFIALTALQQWFYLRLSFSEQWQRLAVESDESLPIELAWEREQRRKQMGTSGLQQRPAYPQITPPYRWFRHPFLDLNLRTNYAQAQWQSSLSALTMGDLLYMDHRLFVSLNNELGLTDVRFTLGRQQADKPLLGPLRATEFTLGDLFTPQVDLAARSQAGVGVLLSNYPRQRRTRLDTVIIRGDSQPGWEVELYRGTTLLDFQQINADGLYEFQDVPLVSGVNEFRIVLYGPEGQQREQFERYFLDPNEIDAGQWYYRFAANRHNEDLFSVNEPPRTSDSIRGRQRYIAEAEYGLGRFSTLSGNWIHLPLRGGRMRDYVGLGYRTTLKGWLAQLNGVRDLSGQSLALQGLLQGRWMDTNIMSRYRHFQTGFISEDSGSLTDPIRDNFQLRLNRTLALGGFSIPVQSSLEYTRFQHGRRQLQLDQRLSTAWRRLRLSNTFDYRRQFSADDIMTEQWSGALLLNSSIGRAWQLRGSINYRLKPESTLNSTTLTADYRWRNDWWLGMNIQHAFEDRSTTYSVRLSQGSTFSINTGYGENGITLGVSLALGLGLPPTRSTPIIVGGGLQQHSPVLARAFLDHNYNAIFDASDEALPEVGFRVEQRASDNLTDLNGQALVLGGAPYQAFNLTLDQGTLEDPYWITTRKGIEIITRPGVPLAIDFPVVNTGEVEGTVYQIKNERQKAAANVLVELVDVNGKITNTATSTFDGFYLLENVIPGRYQVRLSPGQVSRLEFEQPAAKIINLAGETPLVTGIDFVLVKNR